jgi:hypothetical protein
MNSFGQCESSILFTSLSVMPRRPGPFTLAEGIDPGSRTKAVGQSLRLEAHVYGC